MAHSSQTVQTATTQQPKVAFGLHGIRTHADWQRTFGEVAHVDNWNCRTSRWNFGFFSAVRLFLPWQRRTKIRWFRTIYTTECDDRNVLVKIEDGEYPSIVAHSFGTFILGNALLRYDYIKFNKVILCGSILPRDFPWDIILDRGQVQEVRNEYGTKDFWSKYVNRLITGTGPSGAAGFTCKHTRLVEEEFFDFEHSDYFETGHMKAKWLTFLNKPISFVPSANGAVSVPAWRTPWLCRLIWLILISALLFGIGYAIHWFRLPTYEHYTQFCDYQRNSHDRVVRAIVKKCPRMTLSAKCVAISSI